MASLNEEGSPLSITSGPSNCCVVRETCPCLLFHCMPNCFDGNPLVPNLPPITWCGVLLSSGQQDGNTFFTKARNQPTHTPLIFATTIVVFSFAIAHYYVGFEGTPELFGRGDSHGSEALKETILIWAQQQQGWFTFKISLSFPYHLSQQ